MEIKFTREDTKVIKGFAIILMLIHHLWRFPDRIAGGCLISLFSVFGQSSIIYIGRFAKICVSLFFFVGGYGIYKSEKNSGGIDIINKIKGLYLAYWKVFLIFIPVAFLFFGDQPVYCAKEDICNKFATFSWNELLQNFLGIHTTYNEEWWFLIRYVYAIITFPLIKKICEKCSTVINITLVVVGCILVSNFFPAIGNLEVFGKLNDNILYNIFFCPTAPFIACFWMGCIAAKDDLLIKLYGLMDKNHMLTPLLEILIGIMIVYLRNDGLGDSLDIFYVPVLIIIIIDFTNRIKLLRNILFRIGLQSTNMWLIHSFYCYYFYTVVKIVVAPRWAISSLVLLIFFTYVSSSGVTYVWKRISGLIQMIRFHINKIR